MVFLSFIFQKLSSNMNLSIFILMMIYMISAMGTIYFLVRVIVPRIQKETIDATIDEVEKQN